MQGGSSADWAHNPKGGKTPASGKEQSLFSDSIYAKVYEIEKANLKHLMDYSWKITFHLLVIIMTAAADLHSVFVSSYRWETKAR